MTREEAIAYFKDMNECTYGGVEPIQMAIKALEQQLCEDEYIKVPKGALKYRTAGMVAYNVEWLKNHFDIERAVICRVQHPCDDAISRYKAIVQLSHLLSDWDDDWNVAICKCIETIKALPPVTPQSCTDAISREELLKAIDTWDKFGYTETGCFVREPKGDYVPYIHYDDVIKSIKGMPPVTPQPKMGHWEWVRGEHFLELGDWVCSECKSVVAEYVRKDNKCKIPTYKYCPQCGHKMQDIKNEHDG